MATKQSVALQRMFGRHLVDNKGKQLRPVPDDNDPGDKACDDKMKFASDDEMKCVFDGKMNCASDDKIKCASDDKMKCASDDKIKYASDDKIKYDPNDQLKDKSIINKLFQVLKCTIPGSGTALNCDDCGDTNAVAFCINCTQCLCKICYNYHSNKKKQHSIVLLGEESFFKFCPLHPEERECKFYCETCDQFACLYCMKTNHEGHTHDTTDKMAFKHRLMLTKMITPAEEIIENLSKVETNILSAQEKMKEQASEIDQEIDKSYHKQLQELNKHHRDLKEQLHKAVSQKQEALEKQVKNVISLRDEAVKLKASSKALKKTPDHKVFSTKKQDIEIHVQNVSEQYKSINTEPVEYDNFEYVPVGSYSFLLGHLFTFANPYTSEVINLPGNPYCGDKVEFKIIAKDSKGKNCTKGGSQVCIQLKSFTGDVTVGEVRDNSDGSYTASFVTKQVGGAKLSVAINGEQIKGSPYSIVVGRNYQAIDKSSTKLNDNGNMGTTHGIAFGKNGLWAIADSSNHRVYIFDDKDQLVRKFGSNGSNNGQFSYPRGVAFDSHNHLYVTDSHRVQKFDTNGNYLLQFGSLGANDGQLNYPFGVAVHCDKVYVVDSGNKHISVFQDDGKFCTSFGSDQLGRPRNVAVSADNHLLVADLASCIYTILSHWMVIM